ncbi:unnamed protein product, partial [Ectocarpus sp. 12 AP-2014]
MYSAVVCSVSHHGMRRSTKGDRGRGGREATVVQCMDGCFDYRGDGGKVGVSFTSTCVQTPEGADDKLFGLGAHTYQELATRREKSCVVPFPSTFQFNLENNQTAVDSASSSHDVPLIGV